MIEYKLKSLKNPSTDKYEIKIIQPELTFLGVKEQPDLAELIIRMYPSDTIIELKSLKYYLMNFRNKIISYERLINVIYDDLIEKYKPTRLTLTLNCRPRGGISSNLTIDSQWRKPTKKFIFDAKMDVNKND